MPEQKEGTCKSIMDEFFKQNKDNFGNKVSATKMINVACCDKPTTEYLMLKLKDLLLSKEYEIQLGRLELEEYGKWQTNHGEIIGYIDQEIDFLYQKIEGRI